MSQPWKLSQTANKDKGRCSVCHVVRQVHLNDGCIHQHGPRNNRCLGSNKPPLHDPILSQGATPSAPSVLSNINTISASTAPHSAAFPPATCSSFQSSSPQIF